MCRFRLRQPLVAGSLLFTTSILYACSNDVAAPSPQPGVVIATTQPSVEIRAGDAGTIGVHLTRVGGFAGPISLSVAGAPPNVSAAISANPVTGDVASIAMNVGVNVAAGEYPISVNATAAGISTQAATFALRVNAATPTIVQVAYCDVVAPAWVAFQDGDGAWVRETPLMQQGRSVFAHEIGSARGAVATLTRFPNSPLTVLRVFYGARAELATVGDTLGADCDTGTRTWFGHVAGLQTDEKALVSTGQGFRVSVLNTEQEFGVVGFPLGTQDVLATRSVLRAEGVALTGFILRRGVDLADGARMPDFDFGSAEVFAPASAMLTIAGAGNEVVHTLSELHTLTNTLAQPPVPGDDALATRRYWGIPTNRLLPGDVQLLHLSTEESASASRTADVPFSDVVDRTVTFGRRIIPPALGAEQLNGTLGVRATFGSIADYDQATPIALTQRGVNALVSLSITSSYGVTANGTFDLAVPDLTTVSGFQNSWGLRPGMDVDWEVTRTGGTFPLGRTSRVTPGLEHRTANIRGTLLVR